MAYVVTFCRISGYVIQGQFYDVCFLILKLKKKKVIVRLKYFLAFCCFSDSKLSFEKGYRAGRVFTKITEHPPWCVKT